MKVWIVAKENYSDWRIAGVFSSKEKAQEYIDSHPFAEDIPYIVDDGVGDGEWEVDTLKAIPPKWVRVTLTRDKRGNENYKIREVSNFTDEYYNRFNDIGSETYSTTIEVNGKDAEQLIKIALDRRRECMYRLLERGEL